MRRVSFLIFGIAVGIVFLDRVAAPWLHIILAIPALERSRGLRGTIVERCSRRPVGYHLTMERPKLLAVVGKGVLRLGLFLGLYLGLILRFRPAIRQQKEDERRDAREPDKQ